MSESEYPSLAQQVKNLANFSFEVVKTSLEGSVPGILVNENVKEERLSVCRECPAYDASQKRCKECGCFLEHKAKFAVDSCPLGKWRSLDTKVDVEQIEVKEEDLPPVPRKSKFPSNPQLGDIYTDEETEKVWQYDGQLWRIVK